MGRLSVGNPTKCLPAWCNSTLDSWVDIYIKPHFFPNRRTALRFPSPTFIYKCNMINIIVSRGRRVSIESNGGWTRESNLSHPSATPHLRQSLMKIVNKRLAFPSAKCFSLNFMVLPFSFTFSCRMNREKRAAVVYTRAAQSFNHCYDSENLHNEWATSCGEVNGLVTRVDVCGSARKGWTSSNKHNIPDDRWI